MGEVGTVSFQTLFWVLTPLAVNNWGQPSGRILSYPPEQRIYIQSYPIFAAADALSILFGFIYLQYTARLPARLTLDVLMYQRFEGCEKGQRVDALRKGRWMRLLCFSLGVIQPAVKLAALKGVPFGQVFGYMWLGSWIVIEIVALFARELNIGDLTTEPLPEQEAAREVLRAAKIPLERLSAFSKYLGGLASSLHWVLSFFMLQALVLPRIDIHLPLRDFMAEIVTMLKVAAAIFCFSCLLSTFTSWRPWHRLDQQFLYVVSHWTYIPLFYMFCSNDLLPPFLASEIGVAERVLQLYHRVMLIGVAIMLVGVHIIMSIVCWLQLRKYPAAITALRLGLNPSGATDEARREDQQLPIVEQDDPEFELISVALRFLLDLVLALLWLAYRYDDRGTINPPWTTVFGKR